MSASPLPERYAVELPRRRTGSMAWYVAERWSPEEIGEIRGGPFATAAEAQATIHAWHEELDELYEAVERRAREEGVTVAWSR